MHAYYAVLKAVRRSMPRSMPKKKKINGIKQVLQCDVCEVGSKVDGTYRTRMDRIAVNTAVGVGSGCQRIFYHQIFWYTWAFAPASKGGGGVCAAPAWALGEAIPDSFYHYYYCILLSDWLLGNGAAFRHCRSADDRRSAFRRAEGLPACAFLCNSSTRTVVMGDQNTPHSNCWAPYCIAVGGAVWMLRSSVLCQCLYRR